MKKWNKQTWGFIIAALLLVPFILSGESFDTSKAQEYRILEDGYFGINNTSFESNITAKIINRETNAHTAIKAALDVKELNPQLHFIRVQLFGTSGKRYAHVTWANGGNYHTQGWDVITQDKKGKQLKYDLNSE